MKNYWALVSNPKNYRIEDAIRELEQDTWTVKGSNITRGDFVAIWKSQGGSKNWGIICLGEVVSNVEEGNDKNNPYWINRDMALQEDARVIVKYIHAPGLPLWIGGSADNMLRSLSVAKSQGGTVFKINPEQWNLIIEAAGGKKDISYWWVNHKQTYEMEINGGYIWSPKTNRNGAVNQTYINLTKVKPGDIVVSYANAKISAIGAVTAYHREQNRPSEFEKLGEAWSYTGWAVPIEWTKLDNPILPKRHIDEISPLLPDHNSPLQKNGNGNQGCYLASISDGLGSLILTLAKKEAPIVPDLIVDIQGEIEADEEERRIRTLAIDETEKEQLVKSRRGQGVFRRNVEGIENGCRLTKIANKQFLIASHIKPWKDSTNPERLDGNNGLLLSPHVDKLFDSGWISFTDAGDILCVDSGTQKIMKAWGLSSEMNVGAFNREQRKYLEYHRKHRYGKRNKLK